MFRRSAFSPSGLRYLVLTSPFCVGGCNGRPPDAERRVVHEWAVQPTDLMAKGEYEEAVRHVSHSEEEELSGNESH
jgi:hypothetical protein